MLQPHSWTLRSVAVFIDGMQTRIRAVDENEYTLRLSGEPRVYLVNENGYDFED